MSDTYPNKKSWLCYQTSFLKLYIKVNIECKCISKQADIDGISVWTGNNTRTDTMHFCWAMATGRGNAASCGRMGGGGGGHSEFTRLCVCFCVYMCEFTLRFHVSFLLLVPLVYWVIWTWIVDTTGFGRSLRRPPEAFMLRTLTAHAPNSDDLWRCQWETVRPWARLSCGFTFHANSWQEHEIPAIEHIPCRVILVLKKTCFNKFSYFISFKFGLHVPFVSIGVQPWGLYVNEKDFLVLNTF